MLGAGTDCSGINFVAFVYFCELFTKANEGNEDLTIRQRLNGVLFASVPALPLQNAPIILEMGIICVRYGPAASACLNSSK
jgi:hypothetical protein